MADQVRTAQQSVESIFHSVNRAIEFASLFKDMFDLASNVARAANNTTSDLESYGDLGEWRHVVTAANAMAGKVFVHFVDDYAYLNGLITVRLFTALESGVNDLAVVCSRRGTPGSS